MESDSLDINVRVYNMYETMAALDQLCDSQECFPDVPFHDLEMEGLEDISTVVVTNVLDRFRRKIHELGIEGWSAQLTYEYLKIQVSLLEADVHEFLGYPNLFSVGGFQEFVEEIFISHSPTEGRFLKPTVAQELIKVLPPENMMSEFGYHSIDEFIAEMDLYTIFSLLRISETSEWQRRLFGLYAQLAPEDFEVRQIVIQTLDPVLYRIAVPRLLDKLTLWEDKVMGTIFGIPIPNRSVCPAPTLRTLSKVYHYLAELCHHSEFVQHLGQEPICYGKRFASAIQGKFSDVNFFEPHALCEGLYWQETGQCMTDLLSTIGEFAWWMDGFGTGGYIATEQGKLAVISVDLFDVLSDVSHNKTFPGNTRVLALRVKGETFRFCAGGLEPSLSLILENMDRGYIDIRSAGPGSEKND